VGAAEPGADQTLARKLRIESREDIGEVRREADRRRRRVARRIRISNHGICARLPAGRAPGITAP
jgi:hypothetical protein